MGRGFVACLPETAFSHCRALRSRASSEELKARKKLNNLEFCYHAHNAKFEKAIPVPTRARPSSTHDRGTDADHPRRARWAE
eukprot:scaffold73703_cov36-Phaeocystis_antarctica.AAC.1